MDLARQLQNLLGAVSIRPRRLWLDTADVRASVPMLRSVWGAALHALNHSVYQTVFEGAGPDHERTPLFVLRPAPLSRQGAVALDWITIGAALDQDPCLLAAWQRACEMGLGPDRKPFRILDVEALGSQGAGGSDGDGAGSCWPLGQAAWPFSSAPAETACRLVFPAPLRIMRKKRLLEQPTLADLVVAGLRRVAAVLPASQRDTINGLKPALLEMGRLIPAEAWRGERLDLVRYSARQEAELEMRGVSGSIDLPQGPKCLWPLLAALMWLHVGKGAVVGMGQLVVEPL